LSERLTRVLCAFLNLGFTAARADIYLLLALQALDYKLHSKALRLPAIGFFFAK